MKIKNLFKSRLKLEPGTRTTSFLFIATSIVIAAGILFAANMYYNIDTGEVVVEEIQRVARVLRATAGLIVGGASNQNPASGYGFEVATSSLFSAGNVVLSAANQELRFTGGTGNYIGIKAPTTLSYTLTYTLPTSAPTAENYVLTSDTSGQLSWSSVTGTGAIVQVGDALGTQTTGRVFTTSTGTQYGNTLWFHPNATYTMALTAADSGLTANATTVIPAVSGTNYLMVTPGSLTSGRIMFATGDYTLGQDANLYWSTSTRYLQLGSAGNRAEIRIYSSAAAGYYLGFTATSTMTQNTTYYWPASIPSDANTTFYFLRTDSAGNLFWATPGQAGAVTGQGAAGRVAFWDSTSSIASDPNFTWSTSTLTLTIGGTLIVNTIKSPAGTDLVLNSQGDTQARILLGNGDWIETAQGYQIGKSGTQVLREMIPIMGFDLPFRCGNACNTATTVSRTIEDYPFSSAAAGTTRVHKFVIRYADTGSTASSTWIVWNETDSTTTDTFTVPATNSDLSKGKVYITGNVNIPPAGKKWHLRLQTPSGMTIQVYQIFLAAYDQIL